MPYHRRIRLLPYRGDRHRPCHDPLLSAISTGQDLALAIIAPIIELAIAGILGFLTLRLFYDDYRFLPFHWVMYVLFLLALIMMANGLLGGGEIVSNVLVLLVLVFYIMGFLITFIDYQRDKKEGLI